MGACREMRLPRSESESQSISPFSGALDYLPIRMTTMKYLT